MQSYLHPPAGSYARHADAVPLCNTTQNATCLAVCACQLSEDMSDGPVVPCKPIQKARYSSLVPKSVPGNMSTHTLLLCSLLREGQKIGFPLLVKARLGGGGKGMKLARHADDMEASLACCHAPLQPLAR